MEPAGHAAASLRGPDICCFVVLIAIRGCVGVLKKQWNVATAIWPHLSATGERRNNKGKREVEFLCSPWL